ncbi:MAG: 4Fe-4S binding protein, partial [Bacilli bacterium]
CNFDAIKNVNGKPVINEFSCEGCGLCAYICPANAIHMEECVNGETLTYDANPRFATAKLRMGSGASGKLVSKVKENLRSGVITDDIAIIDGTPGLGCPVIASMSGVDMSLIVTEPTLSGISDLERIIAAAAFFEVKCAVCINKYDINLENTKKIKKYCDSLGIKVIGTIPFDKMVNSAINNRMSVVDIDCKAGEAIKSIFKDTIKIFNEKEK